MLSSGLVKNTKNFNFAVAGRLSAGCGMPSGVKDPLWVLAGARLSHLRSALGMPASRLGILAGLSYGAVGPIEDGKYAPKVHTLEQIACALGVSPSWIAFGYEGFEPFQQRRPREVVPLDPPEPQPGERPATERYRGIGARCLRLRQLRGLSLRVVAGAAGISHESLNLVEKGSTVPLVSTCERLAVALDCAPSWLTYGEGKPPEGLDEATEAAS